MDSGVEESTEENGTLNADERSKLTTFLAQEGALLSVGRSSPGSWREKGAAPDFRHTPTADGVRVSDDAGTLSGCTVAGRAFDGMGTFLFDAQGEYDADTRTCLHHGAAARRLRPSPMEAAATAAVQFADGCERLLVLGFPLEVVRLTPVRL
jgi:hypothetical protein